MILYCVVYHIVSGVAFFIGLLRVVYGIAHCISYRILFFMVSRFIVLYLAVLDISHVLFSVSTNCSLATCVLHFRPFRTLRFGFSRFGEAS